MGDIGSRETALIGNSLVLTESTGRILAGSVVASFAGDSRLSHTLCYFMRNRFTIAQVNAGTANMLSAIPGVRIRMVECKAIAIGGAVATVTTVDLLGTQAGSSVKLVAFAQASLTENTVLTDGGTGAAVLAAGASYTPCDANTGLTVSKTGDDIATATHIDVLLTYNLER